MKIQAAKLQEGSLKKLQNLLNDTDRSLQGVHYTNSFFSRRVVARAHNLVEKIDLKENSVKLTVSTRVERVGLMEIENTLDLLVRHEAGDVPGLVQEGLIDGENIEDQPMIPEIVSVNQQVFSVDVLLIMKEPQVTYQEFKIAGRSFTLVNLHHSLDEEFDQTVSLLFGPAGPLYFFSNFYEQKLSVRDTKIILDLMMGENITGKIVKGIQLSTENLVTSYIFPYDDIFNLYYNLDGDYVFGNSAGYVIIPQEEIKNYRMEVTPIGAAGHYRVTLSDGKTDVQLDMQ